MNGISFLLMLSEDILWLLMQSNLKNFEWEGFTITW